MMKNLKTIIAILVLTFMTFGCGLDMEPFEEDLQILNSKSTTRNSNTTTSLLIEWNTNASISQLRKEQVRNSFENEGLVFIGITHCDRDSEFWEVEEISFSDLISIIRNLGYIILTDPTQLTGGASDPYPVGTFLFQLTYNADCNGQFVR